MSLDELKVYNLAMEIGERVWMLVDKWNYFQKDTMGKQLVRAVDSIAANISEGYGRYHFKENKNFTFYARGSLYETKTWIVKSFNRGLIPQNEVDVLNSDLSTLGKMLNSYIKSIGHVSEPEEPYGFTDETND